MARYETGGSNVIRKVGRLFQDSGGGDNAPVFRPGGSDDDEDKPKQRKPIGVPSDYRTTTVRTAEDFRGMGARAAEGWAAQGAGLGSLAERGPRYFDGDEWRPANNSPAGIAEAQKFLAAAGLLSGNWRWGVWDEKTRNAWKDVLAYANSRGITDRSALIELASAAPSGAGGGGEGGSGGGGGGQWTLDENGNPVFTEHGFVAPPLQLRLPNKQDVKRVLRSSVIEKLGVGWTDGQIDALADQYIAAVKAPQEAAYRQEVDRMEDEFYGREGASEAITTVEAPSLETFAEDELKRRDPGGYQATQFADYAGAFFDALGGYS